MPQRIVVPDLSGFTQAVIRFLGSLASAVNDLFDEGENSIAALQSRISQLGAAETPAQSTSAETENYYVELLGSGAVHTVEHNLKSEKVMMMARIVKGSSGIIPLHGFALISDASVEVRFSASINPNIVEAVVYRTD